MRDSHDFSEDSAAREPPHTPGQDRRGTSRQAKSGAGARGRSSASAVPSQRRLFVSRKPPSRRLRPRAASRETSEVDAECFRGRRWTNNADDGGVPGARFSEASSGLGGRFSGESSGLGGRFLMVILWKRNRRILSSGCQKSLLVRVRLKKAASNILLQIYCKQRVCLKRKEKL